MACNAEQKEWSRSPEPLPRTRDNGAAVQERRPDVRFYRRGTVPVVVKQAQTMDPKDGVKICQHSKQRR
ncbi:hypothetical protein AA101099_0624 [Neoasaia chiangmaiensis NBRC 101099]|nr:hypothetical protein AA101099_0624 [Neoasaia chiangmaiensis NBRC 101099]GEN16480.1 hypothetical protein NCH01_29110 [Neoasaia chiangmaiensis]